MGRHDFKPVEKPSANSGAGDWHKCARCGLRAVHVDHPMVPDRGQAASHSDMVAYLAPEVPFDQVFFPCAADPK